MLEDVLNGHLPMQLSFCQRLDLATDCCRALKYLHDKVWSTVMKCLSMTVLGDADSGLHFAICCLWELVL